ncbi:carbohydrate ABC transporter permease [Thermoflexus sp.]|jgi:multiple sugar transport system permease protein|uniref:carbohydrate ABC transporter permease n=1 Tax=Thermoflexus sp. TaxID=1969742 RepID=UPI00261C5225|nr:carbohydrate ABC transporter permease [Thermoflexus sp.]
MAAEAMAPAKPAVRYRDEFAWWDRIKKPLFYGVLIGWSIIAVTPFYLTVVFSLKPLTHLYEAPFFWPTPFTLENYLKVVTEFRHLFPRWMLNSALVAGLLAVVRTLFCAMGGYAFARLRFPGRDLLFWAMLITMMIPGQVTLIPNFLIVRQMKLLDSLLALIVPGIAGAFGVFMMSQFYKNLPRELEEAAMIDGAGWFTIFFRIVLPISRPALLTLALFTFQGEWNAFMWPLIVLNSPEKFTLPLGLSWFKGEYYTVYSVVLAGSMFNSVPILLLFFLFQGYFTRGIALTGLREG